MKCCEKCGFDRCTSLIDGLCYDCWNKEREEDS